MCVCVCVCVHVCKNKPSLHFKLCKDQAVLVLLSTLLIAQSLVLFIVFLLFVLTDLGFGDIEMSNRRCEGRRHST